MKPRRVRFTAAAHRHFNSKRTWWITNRDHRELFATDLEHAVRILAVLPGIGTSPVKAKPTALRRLLLRKTRCHVYYTFDDDEVVVRAVWGANRGREPLI